MSTETKGLPSQLYEDSGKFGVLTSTIALYIGIGIAIIMLVVGVYLLFSKGTYAQFVTGRVLDSTCTQVTDPNTNKQTQTCKTKVQYIVNGTEYINIIDTASKYDINSSIEVAYNKSNPNDSVQKSNWRRMVGGILLVIAVFIVIGAYIQYYIATKSKFGASAIGTGAALGFVTMPFR